MLEDIDLHGTRWQKRRLVQAGEAVHVCRGLYVKKPFTPWQLLRKLCETRGALASGKTAWEIETNQAISLPLQIVVPHALPASRYFSARRSRHNETFTREQVPVLIPVLACLDLPKDQWPRFFQEVYAGARGASRLKSDLKRAPRVPAIVKEALAHAHTGVDSGAEIKVIDRLRAAGLAPVSNHQIGSYYWDIVLPKQKVAIEIDGRQAHASVSAAIRDSWKHNDASIRGWLTLRYTGHCVAYHLDEVIEQILTARKPDFKKRFFTLVGQWHRAYKRYLHAEIEDPATYAHVWP